MADLNKAMEWIAISSIQQAEAVSNAIINKLDLASQNPERFPPDKFKKNNSGIFRSFETHSYRVSYLYSANELRVLRVGHVHQKPKKY